MKGTERPYLSVIVPAHREEHRLPQTLRQMTTFLASQPWPSEVIVVDDGSPDGTAAAARAWQGSPRVVVRVIEHGQNRGKGAAVRTGMHSAQGTYALFADADNATPIEELPALVRAAEEGADIVMGSRYLPGSRVRRKQGLLRRLMSRGGNLLFRLLLGLRYTDTRCGFKLFSERARRVVFPRQRLERWGFDTEILVIANLHHLKVREVPVEWFDRERGNIHPVRDSLRSLQEIFQVRRARARGLYD